MVIAKQMEVRANIKVYFDMAYDGETIIIPRKQNKNVVIISEENYNRLIRRERLETYADAIGEKIAANRSGSDEAKSSAGGTSQIMNDKKRGKEQNKSGVLGDVQLDNEEKLRVISELQDGWNGNEAPAFSEKLIKKIRDLLEQLEIQPEIFPTALQTVQFEYDNNRRDHMEIEIGMDDEAEVFIVYYNGYEAFEKVRTDAASINERVRSFYG